MTPGRPLPRLAAGDRSVLGDLRSGWRFDGIAAASLDGTTGATVDAPSGHIVLERLAARFGADCIGPR